MCDIVIYDVLSYCSGKDAVNLMIASPYLTKLYWQELDNNQICVRIIRRCYGYSPEALITYVDGEYIRNIIVILDSVHVNICGNVISCNTRIVFEQSDKLVSKTGNMGIIGGLDVVEVSLINTTNKINLTGIVMSKYMTAIIS